MEDIYEIDMIDENQECATQPSSALQTPIKTSDFDESFVPQKPKLLFKNERSLA